GPAAGGARAGAPGGAAGECVGGPQLGRPRPPGDAAVPAPRPLGRRGGGQPPLPPALPRRRRGDPGRVHLSPLLVPRRRLPAGRHGPVRTARRGGRGPSLLSAPPAGGRLL